MGWDGEHGEGFSWRYNKVRKEGSILPSTFPLPSLHHPPASLLPLVIPSLHTSLTPGHVQLCPAPSPLSCPGLAQLQPVTAGTQPFALFKDFLLLLIFVAARQYVRRGRGKWFLGAERTRCSVRVMCLVCRQGK